MNRNAGPSAVPLSKRLNRAREDGCRLATSKGWKLIQKIQNPNWATHEDTQNEKKSIKGTKIYDH
jgi:hypothetical protein